MPSVDSQLANYRVRTTIDEVTSPLASREVKLESADDTKAPEISKLFDVTSNQEHQLQEPANEANSPIQMPGSEAVPPRTQQIKKIKLDSVPSNSNLEVYNDVRPANIKHYQRPGPGASIGAFVNSRHLPPVSLGGMIEIDGKLYGLTVHHMLDDPEEEEVDPYLAHQSVLVLEEGQKIEENKDKTERWLNSIRSDVPQIATAEGTRNSEATAAEPETTSNTAVADPQETYLDSDSHLDLDSYLDLDGSCYNNHTEYRDIGDITGIPEGCGLGYFITQPAINDVDDSFYPDEETMNEDHLDTYEFGEVYASSGIRRRMEDGIVHEIDWALLEIRSDRQQEFNFDPNSKIGAFLTDPGLDGYYLPRQVVPWRDLGGLEVFAVCRTSRYQTGQILDGMVDIKVYGRSTPSSSFAVKGLVTGK